MTPRSGVPGLPHSKRRGMVGDQVRSAGMTYGQEEEQKVKEKTCYESG